MFGQKFASISYRFPLFIALLALSSSGGCKKEEPGIVGFHTYEFGKTTKKDGIACSKKGTQTYCSNNVSPQIAGHKTQTDLYFNGFEEDAPLAEILVGVWNCRPGDLSLELYEKMGEPFQKTEDKSLWKMKNMTAVALLGRGANLCTIHFLAPTEVKRISELFPLSKKPEKTE